jgi:hypothetical protein
MALWLNQPVTEMRTEDIFWMVKEIGRADNLTTILFRFHDIWKHSIPGNLRDSPGL